jgi:RNA polymerase subunit RPABC4/transcription elongation factor Spt4
MANRFVKIFEVGEKSISTTKLVSKEDLEKLRGKIIIINPEGSLIAEKLEIKEKGVFGAKFR